MKGLLKGLKYFTQMFVEEEEEENEIQIGLPTDVKHVAHIGWDGPSANSPSWMEDFKSSGNSSTPSAQANGETNTRDIEQSQDSSTKKSPVKSPGKDLPGLPKSSRRQQSWDSVGSGDSPNGSPTNKAKSSKRRHKNKENSSVPKGESSNLPNMPKKTKKKKPKDAGDGPNKPSRSKEKSLRQGSTEDGSSKQYREANSNMSLS